MQVVKTKIEYTNVPAFYDLLRVLIFHSNYLIHVIYKRYSTDFDESSIS